jgi:hypothetical protein
MSNNQEVELELAERQDLINKYEDLKSLKEDKRFQRLILDGYMKEKAVDTTSLLSTEYGRSIRSTLFEELAAISCFEGYLHMVENLGAPLVDDEEEE